MTNKTTRMKKFKIERDFKTHTGTYYFQVTNYYCLNCGQRDVWEDDSEDYYVGTNLYCLSCASTWNGANGINKCEWIDQILRQIKEQTNE